MTPRTSRIDPTQLMDLPVEILERVIHFIDRPTDLLALGLTCKLMHIITTPYPIDYREIVWPTHDGMSQPIKFYRPQDLVDLNKSGVLGVACAEYLSEDPRRGAAVRQLMVTWKGTIAAPKFLQTHVRNASWNPPSTAPYLQNHPGRTQGPFAHVSDMRALAQSTISSALRNMPFLKSFAWEWFDPHPEAPFWDALLTLRGLRRVSFILDEHGQIRGHEHGTVVPKDVLARIENVIQGCPVLEELNVEITFHYPGVGQWPSWDASRILAMRWPSLRKLRLINVRGTSEDVSMFFERHPTLESICVSGPGFDFSSVGFEALPNLRSLIVSPKALKDGEATGGLGHPFLEPLAGTHLFRPLRQLVVMQLRESVDVPDLRRLLPNFGNTLEHLDIVDWETASQNDAQWIINLLPSLTHLGIPQPRVTNMLDDIIRQGINLERRVGMMAIPAYEKTSCQFPAHYSPWLETWASWFKSLPGLRSLIIRPLRHRTDDRRGLWNSADKIEFSEILRRKAPDVQLVDVHLDVNYGIMITSRRHGDRVVARPVTAFGDLVSIW